MCILISNPMSLVIKEYYSGETALHYAASNGNSNTVKILLEAGANIEAQNNSDNDGTEDVDLHFEKSQAIPISCRSTQMVK